MKRTRKGKRRSKKYKECLQKAEELEKEGKYKDGWTVLPKITDYPEYTDTIRKKQDEYERHFAPSLFSETTTNDFTENQVIS
ncbi:hypothetical protein [Chryseobacterium soldanellicola]|uniref:hypothetical protein n=1 Tax=Chryseobacterium soldanellicola TaxID=311333 RepID=UPI0021CD45FD|nr:hypothetical protein [Chryseobacterium soldanellicola]